MSDLTDLQMLDQVEEVLIRTDEYGNRTFECIVNAERVGVRIRSSNGTLTYECGNKNGLNHGVERHWDDDGSLIFETYWVEGKEHGLARQWCESKLLGTYEMNFGTGIDLWRDCDGTLSEERHYLLGERHGFERWWWQNKAVWKESHFKHDIEHGIFREWNRRGRLRRGYPKYYVNGKQVSKRQYIRAHTSDASLPPFREQDNRPERDLPDEYLSRSSIT